MFFYYDYNNCTSCKFKNISTPGPLTQHVLRLSPFLDFTLYNLLEVGGKGVFLQNGLTSPPQGPVTLYGLKGGGGRGEAGEFWLSHNEIYLPSFYTQLRNDKCVSVG